MNLRALPPFFVFSRDAEQFSCIQNLAVLSQSPVGCLCERCAWQSLATRWASTPVSAHMSPRFACVADVVVWCPGNRCSRRSER